MFHSSRPSGNLFGDLSLIVSLGYFALHLSGPSAVVSLAVAFFHFVIAGRPRLSLLPLYLFVIVAIVGFVKRGFSNSSSAILFSIRSCYLIFVFLWLILDYVIFPFKKNIHRNQKIGVGYLSLNAADNNTVRLYFPAKITNKAEAIPYMLHGNSTLLGLAKFLNMPSFLFKWLLYVEPWSFEADPDNCAPLYPTASTDTYLLKHSVAASKSLKNGLDFTSSSLSVGTSKTNNILNTYSSEGTGKLPIVIFSHGLGGTPDMYSRIISEFVHEGYLVAAIEHNDGSAAFTKLFSEVDVYYDPLLPSEKLFREKQYKRRHGQLVERVDEIIGTLDVLFDLNDKEPGVVDDSYLPDYLRATSEKGQVGAVFTRNGPSSASVVNDVSNESQDVHPVDSEDSKKLSDLEEKRLYLESIQLQFARQLFSDRLDKRCVVLVGHSFGGASVLSAAEIDKRVSAVVMLDPWYFPMSSTTLSRGVSDVPILSILGEVFARWPENESAANFLFSKDIRKNYLLEYTKLHASSNTTAKKLVGGFFGRKKIVSEEKNGSSVRDSYPALSDKPTETLIPADTDEDVIGSRGYNKLSQEEREAICLSRLNIIGSNGVAKDGSVSPKMFTINENVHPSSLSVALRDVDHQSFSDFPVLLPFLFKWIRGVGKVRSPDLTLQLVSALALDFVRFSRVNKNSSKPYAIPEPFLVDLMAPKEKTI